MSSKSILKSIGIGSLMLSLMIGISSCKKEEPNDPDPNVPFYVEFDVDSVTVRYESEVDGYGNGPGRESLHDDNHWGQREFTVFGKQGTHPDSLKNSIAIELVRLLNDSPNFNTVFNFWEIGVKNYGMWNADSTNGSTEGVVFTYTDGAGKVWSSGILYGTQDSSSFEITAHKAVSDEVFNGISEGTFNCQFHDGLGNSLSITNGAFKARTVKDL